MLLAAGAILFVAFPAVFSLLFSGFSVLFALILVALAGRALALKYGNEDSPRARLIWDGVFNLCSVVPPLVLGIGLGNIMAGVPINSYGEYATTPLAAQFNPYPILIGVLTVVLFTMHGAIYLAGHAEGDVQRRAARLVVPLWCGFSVLHLVAAAATALVAPFLYEGIYFKPMFWALSVIWLFGIAMIPYFSSMRWYRAALACSATTIAAIIGLVAVGLFPRLIPSTESLSWSLTTSNAAAGSAALQLTLVGALIGLPLLIAYTAVVYGVFKGSAGKFHTHQESF